MEEDEICRTEVDESGAGDFAETKADIEFGCVTDDDDVAIFGLV